MGNLHVGIFQPPMHGNGLDRVNLNLARSLASLGCSIDLVVPDVTEYHRQAVANFPNNVRTFDLKLENQGVLKKVSKLRQYINQENPSILLSVGDYIGVANAAITLKRKSTRLVHAVHIHVTQYFDATTQGYRKTLKASLLKWAYSSADGVITVSKGIKADLQKNFGVPQKLSHTIYNPVVTKELFDKAKAPLAHPWFLPGEPPVILSAGRLFYQKDFVTLVKAFAKARQQRNCRLMIIGQWSPYKDELDALIDQFDLQKDVDFPGYADNPYAYMTRAALFAMSSRYEGFGNVLVEAMAVGTPVVSTDCESGPAEILGNGQYGKLAPVQDADALAEAIVATLDTPTSKAVLQQRALDFSEEVIARQYLDFMKNILGPNTSDQYAYPNS